MARRDLRNAFGDSSPETNPKPSAEVAVVTGADRSARLAALTRTIVSAWTTYGSSMRAARDQLVNQAGPALEEVHRNELWRAGGHRSFRAWFGAEVGYGSSHVYGIIDAVGVSRVLGTDVNTGQGRALAPVLREHGPDAVKQQWAEAADKGGGKVTAKALKAAAVDLGYRPERRNPSASVEVKTGQTVTTGVADADIVDAEIVADEYDPQPPTLYRLRAGLREQFRSTTDVGKDLAGLKGNDPDWSVVKDVALLGRMISNWARQQLQDDTNRKPPAGPALIERLEEILTDPSHDVLDVTGLDAEDADQLARMARLLDDLAERVRTGV
jgi:hypothetical protein